MRGRGAVLKKGENGPGGKKEHFPRLFRFISHTFTQKAVLQILNGQSS